ncbi:MAG: flotillin family protein [Myxococcales bacterium]
MNEQQLVVAMAGLGALFMFVVLFVFGSRYRKVGPNEALVVSGGRTGFRIVRGSGTFVWPVLETAQTMGLDLMTLRIHTPLVHVASGGPLTVDGVAHVKIDSASEAALATAAEQFLGRSQDDVMKVALETISGHLSAAMGALEAEEIRSDRDKLAARVREAAALDLRNMGLTIVSLTLRDSPVEPRVAQEERPGPP